jgi:hypothetical protein
MSSRTPLEPRAGHLALLLAVAAIVIACALPMSADAAENNEPYWVVSGKTLWSGESRPLTVTPTQPFVIEAAIAGHEILIECRNAESTGANIDGSFSGVAGTGEIAALKFTKCEMGGDLALECEVQEREFTTKALSVRLQKLAGIEARIKPQSGEVLAEVLIRNNGTGTCPATIKGTKDLRGTIIASVWQAESDQAKHHLEFSKTSGTKVTLAENSATFLGAAESELGSKEPFAAL